MHLAQPAIETPAPPFGAIVARQLSVWPFAARTQRLYLLVDQSLPDPDLRAGLLRAMQQAYFRSDSCSQTRAVREAALAAHYVLQHRNREVLPQDQVTAATAVAAVRGGLAYVALAGDAAAFAWRAGDLTGQRGPVRLPRPLGLEQDPHITLWSTPLAPGDRLGLVCGAKWSADSARSIEDILGSSTPGEVAETRLAEALGDGRPAGVLVADPARAARPDRHLVLVSSVERGRGSPAPRVAAAATPHVVAPSRIILRLRLFASVVALVLLGAATIAALNPPSEPPRQSLVTQAQAFLEQADQTLDPYEAHALAASAFDLTQRATTVPGEFAELADQAVQKLNQIDRVVPVEPTMAVRLGPSGVNVVDLAVGEDALYTLDVVEASVRAFNLDGRDQQPTPDTLLARAGAPIAGTPRRLAMPVAMRYVTAQQASGGALTIVDQARTVVEIGKDRAIMARPLSSSSSWRELGALGGDADGNLYVLDSGSRRLLSYGMHNQRLVDPPRVLLDSALAPGLAFDRASEIVGQPDRVFMRMDDGTLHRFDAEMAEAVIVVRPPDGRVAQVAGIAPDRAGGLYLADPTNARILQTTAEGSLVRQLRNPALAGLRQIQSSVDGRRIYGLVASGVLVFDVPETLPQ
ncbi:MAG TPA: hypothetical protein VGQ62_21055 [Chloroflexota bacterium]|jgi:hypothetical protein|nr:hypothetical protein [Chloroflexota bacterium]